MAQYVIIQDGIVIDYPEEVEVIDLDELGSEKEGFYLLSEDAQNYLRENFPDEIPEEEMEGEENG